jgi:hypothetical protein
MRVVPLQCRRDNFADLSVELFDELKGNRCPAIAVLDEDKRAETDETAIRGSRPTDQKR